MGHGALQQTSTGPRGRPVAAGRALSRGAAARAGGVLTLVSGTAILLAIITAEALFPAAYDTSRNTISDLGSTWQPGDIVREPSATIFNTTMLVTGVLIVLAAAALKRATGSRAVSIPLALLGLGVLGVGVFPGTEIDGHFSTSGAHPVFSLLAFTAGGVAAVLAVRVVRGPFRWISAGLGATALLALVLSGALGDTALGEGGSERWVAYPTVLWLVAFGGYLLASAPAGARLAEAAAGTP